MVLVLMTPFLLKGLILVKWTFQQKYIAANLCRERSKPENNCCGKCFLGEELSKTEEGSSKTSDIASLRNLKIDIFNITVPQATEPLLTERKTIMPEELKIHYSRDYNKFCFHPPEDLV